MKCNKCNQEIPNQLVKFESLGIEVDFKQQQNNKKFEDIQIPKEWRLLRFKELDEVMNYIVENDLNIWSYCEQPIKKFKGKSVVRFNAYSDGASLVCNRSPRYSYSSLGVIFCKDLK